MYLLIRPIPRNAFLGPRNRISAHASRPRRPEPQPAPRAINAQVMFEMAFPGGPTSAAGAYANKSAVDLKSEFAKTGGFDGQMAVYGSYAYGRLFGGYVWSGEIDDVE